MFFLWQHFWRLYHYIADTPTSRTATASQGLVELQGTGELPNGVLHRGIPMGPPCLWQTYSITEGEDELDAGQTSAPFDLVDTSGRCQVFPEDAIIISSGRAYPSRGSYKAHIHYLPIGAPLYVLGELRAIGGDNGHYDLQQQTLAHLRRWKEDETRLVADHDSDGDGRLDGQEWEHVRLRAEALAKEEIQLKRQAQVIHQIRKPRNGLPLIISDKDPCYLQRRYQLLGASSLVLAISSFCWATIKFF